MYYRMFATGATIEGSATIAGYSMNNTAMLLDTRDVLVHRTLVDPHVKVEMGKAGSCEFTILPTHTLYDKLKRMVTFITVEEIDPDINHDIVLFKGRIVELETDLYGQKKVTCEGDLAYLGDSYTPPLASKNTVIAVPRYFEEIITQHNGQVEAAKQFTVGNTSAFSGVEDKFSESSYQNSSRALEDLIEYHGGYLRTRHDGGTTYLDYVKDTATPGRAVPRVEFAKNLVDFTEKVSAEDIFTVLIPLGDKTDTGEGSDANSVPLTLTPPKLNVDDVIQDANAISTFGYILRAETFSGVKDAATLRQRAEAYIRANYNALPEEFTVKAIDLRYLDDADAQVPFEVGENITIVVPVRGVSKTLKCLSIQYDLFNPDATEIEVGTGKQEIRQRSLTDQQAQTDAKSRSSAKSAKANTATTEYLTWKDVKAAKELNLTAQKINLLSDSAGGDIVVNQNGTLVFNWDDNKGLNKKVISAASVANTAKDTADTAKNSAKTAQDTADANKTEVEHHAMTLYGANKSYGDWVKDNASLAGGGLMTFFNGKIAALEGYFDSVTANNVTTWGLSAQVSRFASITGHNLTATGITVRTSTDSSGQDVVQLGGSLQQTPPVMTVSGNGTVYVKDIKQLDSAKNWQSVVTHPEYPLLSIKTISNKKYLVAGADTKGQDGYSLNVQKVALEDLLDGKNLADYAQLNTNVTFGTVTGSSFVLPGTNSQGQPNSYTFTKHYIKMDDVAKIAVGVDLPYYLGEDDLDLSHTHEITFVEQKDSSNNPTGKYTLTLKKAVKKQAGTEGETATFSIASTKFFQDAIAGASVYSIAYDGASNTNPAMSVGTKTIPGTSTQVKVLNNVPLLVTYGTNGVTQSTKTYKVSEVELPSVDFQNGSGGTPAISYNANGQPTIDIKAVMGGITVKSKVEYTGSAATISSLAQTANQSITVALDNTQSATNPLAIATIPVTATLSTGATPTGSLQLTMSDLVSMNDVTIGYDSNGVPSVTAKALMGGVTIASNQYTGSAPTLTIARGSGGVSYNSVTGSGGVKEVQITVPVLASTNTGVSTSGNVNAAIGTISWNTASITNSNGSSTVTAIASLGGVEIGRKQFTGTYATADSDNETVRANGWAAALAELEDNNPHASGTLGFGDSRTVTVYMKSQESDTALTTYLTRTYTAPSEPYPILTPKYYGNAISAKMKIDAALNSKSDGTGTAYTNVASKTIELTGSAVTLDARTGSATIIAKVDGTEYATKSVSITAPAPVISVNANGITEKSNKLPVSASLGTTTGLGSMNLEFTVSGGDAISNGPGSSVVQFKYGDKVISEKTVSATYATADSDNETVRANGWAAALNALTYYAPSSETLDFGEAKTVWIQKRATEGAAPTDIFRSTYTAPAKPTINAPTLNTGTINYTTKSVQGGTQFYVQAPIKVTTSVANLGSTGTVDVPIGATVDDATITYDATTGKPTVTANVKVAGVSNAYLATKAFEGAAPTATLSAGTITEKSGELPILAKMGNVQIGSTNLEFTVSGGTSASDNIVQFKYGTNVISEKTVSIGGSLAALTIPDKDDTTHPLRVDDGKLLCNPLYRMSTENQASYWTDLSIGEVSITGGGSIGQYGGEKTIVASVGGVEIGRTTVNATYEAAKNVTVMQPYLDSFGNPKVRAVGSGAMEVTKSTSTRPYYYPRIVVYSGSTITHDITFDANKVLVNANIGSPSTSITTNGYHTASEFGFDYLTGVDVAVTGTGAPSLIYQKLARTDTMFQTFVPNANPYTIPSDWTRFAVILNGNSQIFTISSAINTDPVGNDDAEQGEIEQVYLVSSLTGPLNGQSTTISYRDPHTGNTTTSTGYWYKANAPISSYSATIN